MTTVPTFYFDRNHEPHKAAIECEITDGIGIHVVGLPDDFCKETLLRTVTAMFSKGYRIPGKKLVIHLVHSGRIPHDSGFDLPVAVAMLAESGQIDRDMVKGDIAVYGELRLDAKVIKPDAPTMKDIRKAGRKFGYRKVISGRPFRSRMSDYVFGIDKLI